MLCLQWLFKNIKYQALLLTTISETAQACLRQNSASPDSRLLRAARSHGGFLGSGWAQRVYDRVGRLELESMISRPFARRFPTLRSKP